MQMSHLVPSIGKNLIVSLLSGDVVLLYVLEHTPSSTLPSPEVFGEGHERVLKVLLPFVRI